jgi:hypothetical protein
MTEPIEITATIEFVATVNDRMECLMAQDKSADPQGSPWFNIDVPRGHGLKAGDRVRVTIEKIR